MENLEGHLPPTSLRERFESGDFVVTSEIVPPVSGGQDELLTLAAPFKDRLAGLNVTDGPGARVHMSSVVASGILALNGFNPILQLTCRDRNRIALQAELLGASALGVRDVLFLTGDDPSAGDQPDAKPVFDAKSHELLSWATQMCTEGTLPSGRPIASPPDFFCGAADVPTVPTKGWVPDELLRKADAGASFVQTQLCYDIEIVKPYICGLRDHGLTERLRILIGTGPLASATSARWMNGNLFGVRVPDAVIERLDKADDPKREGRKLCAAFVNDLKDVTDTHGVHLMAPGNLATMPELLDDLEVCLADS